MTGVLDWIIADLKGAGVKRIREAAEAAGVPYGTLRKIVDGVTSDPAFSTVEKIAAYRKARRMRKAA